MPTNNFAEDLRAYQSELKQLDANDKYKTPRRVREREVARYHKNRDHILKLRRENYKRKKLNNEQ